MAKVLDFLRSARRPIPESEVLDNPAGFRRNALEALLFFLPYLWPYRWRVALICLVDLVTIALAFVPPWFGTFLIDRAFPERDWRMALSLALLLFATQLLMQGTLAFRNALNATVEAKLVFDLQTRLYTQLQRVSIRYAESSPVGQRVFRIRIDADAVAVVTAGFFPTLTRFIEFGLVLLAVTALDPFIAVVALAFLIPWTIALVWVTSIYRDLDRKRLVRAELRDSTVLQGASSFALIKAFARQRWIDGKHVRRSVSTQRIANRHYLIWWIVDIVVVRIIPYVRTFIVTLYLYRKVIMGELTLGVTVPMIAYLLRLSEPIQQVVNFINQLRRSMIPAERCMQVLQVKSALPQPDPGRSPAAVRGELAFENVSFAHPNGPPVLQDLTFTLQPGTRTALVGPSGAGKSTIAGLALRLFDPTAGSVRIDGIDLREANLHALLAHVAVVTQETFVFGGTLAENLRYGDRHASADEMRAVLEDVGLGEWLKGLPRGLEQDLESGLALSVGQKQRLGIARALLAKPKMMVLDEPTSALDSETETGVMETLWRVSEGLTVLLVTHRLNTVLRADEVLVLSAGQIVERGSPQALLEQRGAFAKMVETYHANSQR